MKVFFSVAVEARVGDLSWHGRNNAFFKTVHETASIDIVQIWNQPGRELRQPPSSIPLNPRP
jgi:hypothetical protein